MSTLVHIKNDDKKNIFGSINIQTFMIHLIFSQLHQLLNQKNY